MRKVLVLGLMFGMVAVWNTACSGGGGGGDGHSAPVSIAVTGGTTVTVGSTLQLTATATYDDGSTEDITTGAEGSAWTTNSAANATVGAATGLVTGVSTGPATITATHDGISGFATVTVGTGGAATFNFSVSFSSWPHGGASQGTGVRVLQGGTRVFCSSQVNLGATWTVSAPVGLLEAGEDYTVEVYGDSGGGDNNNVYNTVGDHTWSIPITNVAANFAGVYTHGVLAQAGITWPNGTACP